MSKKTSLFFLAILCFLKIEAQVSFLNFSEETILINGVSTTVVRTSLKGDLNYINKFIVKFAKDQLDIRLKDQGTSFLAKEVTINQITDKRGDLIVSTYNIDNEISLNVAFRIGYDVYLDSKTYPTEFAKLHEFLEYYVYRYYNEYLPKYIKEKKGGLAVLEKEQKNALKQIKRSGKVIRKSERRIKKSARGMEKIGQNEKTEKSDLRFSKYQIKTEEAERQIAIENGLIDISNDLLSKLKPKIELINIEIQSGNLTLIDVRAKMKLYN